MTASLFATRDTRVDVLETAIMFNAGVAFLGYAVADDPGSLPRLTAAGAAGAGFGEALLLGINSLVRKTPTSTLRSHRDRLQKGRASEAELRGIERDFLAADEPFGKGIQALPFAAGAAVALVPAFQEKSTSDEQLASGITGGILALDALFIVLAPTLVPSYRTSVQGVGLSLFAGPGNLTLRGQF